MQLIPRGSALEVVALQIRISTALIDKMRVFCYNR